MKQTKPFYESRTYLSLVPLITILLARITDIDMTELEIAQIMEALGLIVSMVIIVLGRYFAKSSLTFTSKKIEDEKDK